jgi:hypothetical protein
MCRERNAAIQVKRAAKDSERAFRGARTQGDADGRRHGGRDGAAREGAARERSDFAECKQGAGREVGVPSASSISSISSISGRAGAYSCSSANVLAAHMADGGGATQTSLAVLEQYTVQDVEGLVAQATHPLPAALRKVRLSSLFPSRTPCRFLLPPSLRDRLLATALAARCVSDMAICVCLSSPHTHTPTHMFGPGWRIHESVEDTKLSTNKQHSLYLCVYVCVYAYVVYEYRHEGRGPPEMARAAPLPIPGPQSN